MEETPASEKSATVTSVGLKFGLFIALASLVFNIVLLLIGMNPMKSDWKGWIGAAITIAIVVFAHKNFKESGDGFMSYGQGFRIAFLAIVISMLVNGLFLYVYGNFIDTGMMDEVWQKTQDDMEARGQSQDQIDVALMWTKKLFWLIYLVFATFIAAVLAVVVPIFTQKKNPDPTLS